MNRSELELELLRAVARAPRRLSLYQLDRHAVFQGLRPPEGISGVLKTLVSDRLISAVPGDAEGSVCYELTDDGVAAIEGSSA